MGEIGDVAVDDEEFEEIEERLGSDEEGNAKAEEIADTGRTAVLVVVILGGWEGGAMLVNGALAAM